jgi:hypothetical protein
MICPPPYTSTVPYVLIPPSEFFPRHVTQLPLYHRFEHNPLSCNKQCTIAPFVVLHPKSKRRIAFQLVQYTEIYAHIEASDSYHPPFNPRGACFWPREKSHWHPETTDHFVNCADWPVSTIAPRHLSGRMYTPVHPRWDPGCLPTVTLSVESLPVGTSAHFQVC